MPEDRNPRVFHGGRRGLAARSMEGVLPVLPHAEALGSAWMALDVARREELLAAPAEPLYVRAPHITSSKRPAWAVKA